MRIYFKATIDDLENVVITEISLNPDFSEFGNIYYFDISEDESFELYNISEENLGEYIWRGENNIYLYLEDTQEYNDIIGNIEIDWDKAYNNFNIVNEIEYTETYENGIMIYSEKPDIEEICKTLLKNCIDTSLKEDILNKIKTYEKYIIDLNKQLAKL